MISEFPLFVFTTFAGIVACACVIVGVAIARYAFYAAYIG